MDSRPIFSAKPTTDVIIDAQKKKPKVPVNAIATAQTPMIRFIGHPELEANYPFFEAWMTKLPHWIEQRKQPYLMVHTPDNIEAPLLAAELYQQLQQRLTLPTLTTFPAQDYQHQITLF